MQQQINKQRGAGMETCRDLGDALQDFLRQSGLSSQLKHLRLRKVWAESVGQEIAARTQVCSFRRGELKIEVDSSALRNEMQFYRQALLLDIREKIKRPFIAQLSFIVRPMEHDVSET